MRAAATAAPSALDRPVADVAADLLGDRRRDHVGRRGVEVHAPPGAVAVEAMADVEVLLEVVAQREVEERPPARRELHRRRQAPLDDGEIAGREVAVEVGHVGADLEPVGARQRRRVDPRPGDDDHPQLRHAPPRLRERGDHALAAASGRRPSRRP